MTSTAPTPEKPFPSLADLKRQMAEVPWQEWLAKYEAPTLPKSLWQLLKAQAA